MAEAEVKPTAVVVGEYECFGTENGLLAFSAEIFFYADNSVNIDWFGLRSPKSGSWDYEKASQSVSFIEEFDLAAGTYIPEVGTLRLKLNNGVQRPHVENGELVCYKRNF